MSKDIETEDGKNEVQTVPMTAEQKAQRTKTTIANVTLLIEMLKGSISSHKPILYANKRVVMLPFSFLPIAEDKDESEYYVSKEIKPQMFSKHKAKKVVLATSSHGEGAPIAVTKLKYLTSRLKGAKSLLKLLEKSIKEAAVKKTPRQELREIKKEYVKLSREERESERGVEMRLKMIQLRAVC